ncbi:NADPH-dependent FMN reductase [Quadrisphaera sp. DSM 44207]|uniref:NADPH-dependent FMN reductase n=1 Tax=Quadrisphaera sp. DSM 44207 TaxID=1881057 RepID=UPI00088239FF|nr:NAD(P)H-dependent oxidoreductase [Quadrisphaera sp. DSM 44207]SDQ76518.1 chromate reductase [Quadrisphaera sp. DSM 44207]
MRIAVLSGSTRSASLNTRVARLVAAARPQDEVVVDAALDRLPFYDGDLEDAGWPPPVAALRDLVAGSDVVVVVTPEYNGTIPGLLGNALDWLSRPHRDSPLQGRPVLVVTATAGRGGGRSAAAHLVAVLERIGARVSPSPLSLPLAGERLQDPALREALDAAVAQAASCALPAA